MLARIPFDQEKRRKVSVRKIDVDGELFARVVVQGSPIVVCQDLCGADFGGAFTSQASEEGGRKIISYACKDIAFEDYEARIGEIDENNQHEMLESDEFRQFLEEDLEYVCSFALTDDVIPEFTTLPIQSITGDNKGGAGNVTVRMVTGDMLETAIEVAKCAGILPKVSFENEEDYPSSMTAADLKTRLQDKNFDVNQFMNNPEFHVSDEDITVLAENLKNVRVLAYCSPEDKHFFVGALRIIGAVVMMAGESISDIAALKNADVGISMDNGCDAAKDNADLVIVKDSSFQNVKDSLMWGRQLYQNV